jgi:hypothetical protein
MTTTTTTTNAIDKVWIIQQTNFAYNDGYVSSYKPEKFYLTQEDAENALADMLMEDLECTLQDIWNDQCFAPVGSEVYDELGCEYDEADRAECFDAEDPRYAITTMAELKEYVKNLQEPLNEEGDWYDVFPVSLG